MTRKTGTTGRGQTSEPLAGNGPDAPRGAAADGTPAARRRLGRGSASPAEEPHPFREKTLASEMIFQGKVATVRVDEVLHPSGAHVAREVVGHPGGVVVCPIRDDGRILFVEQWRYPLGRVLLELPAGKLDWTDGGYPHGTPEDPFDAIRRELWEETGYEAAEWEEITYIFTAPGFCDEKLWLYKATGLKDARHKQNRDALAQPSEHEWLDVIALTPAEAFEKIRRREIVDSKTITLLCLCFADKLPGQTGVELS